ncbi:MAG: hypothetical protein RLZZ366_349 [Pseudomonadota bacterium]|jgi:uncharacterized protein
MTLSMYQASVPPVIRALTALQGVIEKGKAHAAAKGTDEANYLSMRITPDMLPLSAQVRIACDIAKRGVGRLAGVEAPVHEDSEASFDDLKARCQSVIDFLGTLTAEQIDGSEGKEITLPTPKGELKFTGQDFLFGFILGNVHFHSSMFYAMLRGAGVEIGKADYLGAP